MEIGTTTTMMMMIVIQPIRSAYRMSLFNLLIRMNHSFESRDGVERAVTIQSILVPAPIQQQEEEEEEKPNKAEEDCTSQQ